jgi:predicted  nucleic acid-binding Zn-ribbon protein
MQNKTLNMLDELFKILHNRAFKQDTFNKLKEEALTYSKNLKRVEDEMDLVSQDIAKLEEKAKALKT